MVDEGADARTGADGDGEGDGDGDAGALDVESFGAVMVAQLFDLIESWTMMLEGVARQGADPKPLLQTLAGTLRQAADQLDPPAGS